MEKVWLMSNFFCMFVTLNKKMERNLLVDDVLIYCGAVYPHEKGRYQIVIKLLDSGTFHTKFVDNGDLNVINVRSGYFSQCEVIDKNLVKIEMGNGVPLNWDVIS